MTYTQEYAALVLPAVINDPHPGSMLKDFGTLQGVVSLFSRKDVVLPGWLHYIAFDLLTGQKIAHEASAAHMPRLIVAPILVFVSVFDTIS